MPIAKVDLSLILPNVALILKDQRNLVVGCEKSEFSKNSDFWGLRGFVLGWWGWLARVREVRVLQELGLLGVTGGLFVVTIA